MNKIFKKLYGVPMEYIFFLFIEKLPNSKKSEYIISSKEFQIVIHELFLKDLFRTPIE